jgi:hypothetical protein
MVPRRILAGMAAALALSIWTGPAIASGFKAFRLWMVERLADWDTGKPSERTSGLATEWSRAPRFPVGLVATDPNVSSARRVAGAISPGGSEREGGGSNRSQTGLKEPVAGVRPAFPAALTFEPISWDDGPDSGFATTLHPTDEAGDWVSTAGDASIELRLALELCRFAGGIGTDPTASGPSARPQVLLAAGLPADGIFEENPDGYEPAEADSASASAMSSRPPAMMAGPSAESIEPSEDAAAFDVEGDRWDGEHAWAPEFPPAPTIALRCFEPIVGAKARPLRIGHQRDGDSAGIGIDPPKAPGTPGRKPAGSASGSSGHDELGRAIALTRDAARAWMDVLAGPTSVRVTSR